MPLAGGELVRAACAPQADFGALGLLHGGGKLAAFGKGKGVGKGVAFLHELEVEVGAVFEVHVAQEPVVAVAVGGKAVADQAYVLGTHAVFGVGAGGWTVTLHGGVLFVGFGCVDADKPHPFFPALHVDHNGVAIAKLFDRV